MNTFLAVMHLCECTLQHEMIFSSKQPIFVRTTLEIALFIDTGIAPLLSMASPHPDAE